MTDDRGRDERDDRGRAGASSLPLDLGRVLDAVPRAIAITDRDGQVQAWNSWASTTYGWSADEVRGADVIELLVGPDDRAEAQDVLARVLAGEVWKGDFTLRHRDGTPRQVYILLCPLRGAHGQVEGVVSSADDVSHVRGLEREAAELAGRLQLALAAGHLGTWQWDLRTGELQWDDTTHELFGLEPGTFDGTYDAWTSLVHPDDLAHLQSVIDRAVREGSSYQVDHRVVRPDGSVRWLHGRGTVLVEHDGTAAHAVGCVADITARKTSELESALRAAELGRLATLERRERERLEFLGGLSLAAIDAPDHEAFLRAVTESAVPKLGDWCMVHFLPRSQTTPEVVVAHADPSKAAWAAAMTARFPYDPDASRGVARVIRTGEVEFYPEITADLVDAAIADSRHDSGALREVADQLALTSAITVPLRTKRGTIGAMQFVTAESGRRYDESDLALTQAVAGRVAEALENMWLSDQQVNIAVTLQEALLPPALPQIPGVEVAARYWAAGVSAVGGDFYDVFAATPDRWAIVIGDVCGTGASAAAVTSIARHTIRAAAKHGNDHAGVLDWLDDALKHANRGSLFVSTCIATIEREGGHWVLRSTSGGHPLPVLVRSDGKTTAFGEPGTILGILDTIRCSTSETTLEAGDTLVFYTDGLTDVRPPHGLSGEEVEEIARIASEAASAEAVAERIRQQIAERLPMSARTDDIALVVVRITD